MAKLYGILAILGWAWAIVVFIYLFIRLRKGRAHALRGGFEVEVPKQHHDEQR